MIEGIVFKGLSDFYQVRCEDGARLEVRARGKLKRGDKLRIGDRVMVDEEALVITEIMPRTTVLKKPPVANADQVFVTFAAREPAFHWGLLNRFLLEAERLKIPHIRVIVTKADLLTPGEREALKQQLSDLPYDSCLIDPDSDLGAIRAAMKDHISVLMGPSGVGKSSLLNRLLPHIHAEVGDLSKIQRGKHTTRHVELIDWPEGGFLADTPGFSLLEYQKLELLSAGELFPEIRAVEEPCYYTGCLHLKEPDCAVKAAVQDGRMSPARYEVYVNLMQEIKENQTPW